MTADGNLTGWGQVALIVLGVAMIYFGLPVAVIGGYAGRAKALGLKPFDNSYRRRARAIKSKTIKRMN